jgi:hypothetical protein
VHGSRKLAVGLPCIVLQRVKESVVERIQFGHRPYRRTSYGLRAVCPDADYHADGMTERCIIVVDEALPTGLAVNAAAVLALTLGATVEGLVGTELVDGDGERHPGLIPQGLPVLRARGTTLGDMRERAIHAGVGVIGFPALGQQTNDYDEFRAWVAGTPTAALEYLGLALHGARRAVSSLTGSLALLR